MSGVVAPLLQWLNENPEMAAGATFIISAAESIAIIGTIVPGSVTMTAIGALAGAGVIPLWSTIFWAIIGAIVGDGISYWIGHYFKGGLRRMWPFRDNPGILQRGEIFVHKYGVISVFIGRFVGPVRALVPLVAGMLGMKPIHFTVANVTSAIGWAPAYMLPGILLGAAAQELPPDIALHVIMVFFLMVLFFGLCFWLLVKFIQLIHIQIDQMQNWIWRLMQRNRLLAPFTTLLKHHDHTRTHGQLNLAFYFLIFGTLFLALSAYVHATGADTLTINQAFYHMFRGLRHATVDNVMIVVTMLGQKQVLAPVAFCMVAYLLYCRYYRVAAHTCLLVLFAIGGTFVFKHIIQSARPWGIAHSPDSFSMPSGHTVLSTVLFFGTAFLLTNSSHIKRGKWFIYTLATLVCLAVATSRMYLGAHWFTDVLSGWLLGATILCFVIISYERTSINRINAAPFALILIATLLASSGLYLERNFTTLKESYTQLDWPVKRIDEQSWWLSNKKIPAYRSSLFGFPSQPINVQWAGKLDDIQQALEKAGWGQPPARDLVSTLHRIADIGSAQYLPMISPQYQDKTPALIMTKSMPGIKNLLVIRLWDSSRVMAKSSTPLWVGVLSVVPRTYSWVTRRNVINIEAKPELVLPRQSSWEYKLLDMTHSKKPRNKKSRPIRVLLIRPTH